MHSRSHNTGLLRDESGMGAETTGNPLYSPWQAISALATETGQAVRQTFSDSGVGTSGLVQQSSAHHAASLGQADADQSKPRPNGQISAAQQDADSQQAAGRIHAEAVQADVAHVEKKLLSTDAVTEVILRFNFLSGTESRVR